jgi:hypothetical protein
MRISAGKLLYELYYRPLGVARDCLAAGGPIEQRRTALGRRAMENAARALPILPAMPGPPLELHLLTGRRFWYQTAFCLWTFSRHANRRLAPVIYDDGTLTSEFSDPITRLFPATRFVPQAEILARLDTVLPAARFPVLRERWINYPNIRKLTDVHAGHSGWKLVIDSDLLFFRRPEFLLNWLAAPDRPLHAVDCTESYGYSRPLMQELARTPIAPLVNVGLCGLRSESLDWAELEHWCATLIAREKAHYYLEQALVAMLVAGQSAAVAPAADYVTLPPKDELSRCRAVMHHYVANTKRWYFQQCWRTALLRAEDPR